MPDLIARAQQHSERVAIVDSGGSYTYAQLLEASSRVAATLLDGQKDLREQRVAFLVTPGFPWVAVQWGIWRAGGIAVPLPLGTPWSELAYYVEDTQASSLICDDGNELTVEPAKASGKVRVVPCSVALTSGLAALPAVANPRRAMILYTSGTTSKPKGVVTTHTNIAAQIASLATAWEWTADDRIVLCLPLHHVHGIINVVSCALWSGAVCEMLPRFDADAIWARIAAANSRSSWPCPPSTSG